MSETNQFYCRVERDSVNRFGNRLTTFVVTIPRIILAEIRTHRVLVKGGYVELDTPISSSVSMNSASSRAIPARKMLAQIKEFPYVPEQLFANQAGMSGSVELRPETYNDARDRILDLRTAARRMVQNLDAIGVHKQHSNRYLEPWMWVTLILSGTEWDGFFAQRAHPAAQPEFQKIAYMMKGQYDDSTPMLLRPNQWHAPFTDTRTWLEAYDYLTDLGQLPPSSGSILFGEILRNKKVVDIVNKISAGRCARVSYLGHDGVRDIRKDLELAQRLAEMVPGHWSPFEHVARPSRTRWGRSGNYCGFVQLRKQFPGG